MNGRTAAIVTALAVAIGLAGCGSGSGSGRGTASGPTATSGAGSGAGTGSPTRSTATRPGRSPAHRRLSAAERRLRHAPPVGVRQGVHIDGTYLTVNVERVVTLTHTGSRPLPGTRAVGVHLQLANQAGTTYDSTSSGDVSLVLSRGMSTPLDIRRGACETPLIDFESALVSGDVRNGCVAFSVPRAARVGGVRFSPFSRPRGMLTWRVPRR